MYVLPGNETSINEGMSSSVNKTILVVSISCITVKSQIGTLLHSFIGKNVKAQTRNMVFESVRHITKLKYHNTTTIFIKYNLYMFIYVSKIKIL